RTIGGRVLRPLVEDLLDRCDTDAVDLRVELSCAGDRGTTGAVAVDAVADVMEAFALLPVDHVLGTVGSVADLHHRDAVQVTGEGEADELAVEANDLLEVVVLLEGVAVVDRLESVHVEQASGASRHLSAHLRHRVFDVANAIEVELETLLVSLAELGIALEALDLIVDQIVDALATLEEQVRRRGGLTRTRVDEPDHAVIDVVGVALACAYLAGVGEGELVINEAALGAGVEGER